MGFSQAYWRCSILSYGSFGLLLDSGGVERDAQFAWHKDSFLSLESCTLGLPRTAMGCSIFSYSQEYVLDLD